MVSYLDRVLGGLFSCRKSLSQEIAVGAIIFFAAFLPRVVSLGTMITSDENLWLRRAPAFMDGLATLNLTQTFQQVHPGVTLMWISGLSTRLSDATGGALGLAAFGFEQHLFFAVLPVALATALGVVAIFFLARELFGLRIAALATVIIAFDPYLVGHSRVLQLDALLATFMLISALAMLVYLKKDDTRFLLFAALAAGLAVLTKSSGLFMVPFLLLALAAGRYYTRVVQARMPFQAYLKGLVKPAAAVLVIMAAVFFLVWPAMWVAPVETLGKYVRGVNWALDTAHELGGFFMGGYLDGNFPLHYYPVVFLMRSTPFALIFAPVAAAFLIARALRRRFSTRELWVSLLLVYVVAFTVEMTLGDKKLDRYLLPAFPAADLLGAVGIGYCLEAILGPGAGRIGERPQKEPGRRADIAWGASIALVTFASLAILVPLHPYDLAYYNPVIPGNPSNASNVLMIGWGDGMDAAARYLNEKPDAASLKVAVNYGGLDRFFHGQTVHISRKYNNLTDLGDCDYIVFYASGVQRKWNEGIMVQLMASPPEKLIRLNGIDYCWIYKLNQTGLTTGG